MIKRKIIIDCDPGIDDALALLLALHSPELEVIGITIVCGNVPVNLGAQNAAKILQLIGRDDIPIYLGAEKPLNRPLITAQDTHGEDGLGETNYPPVNDPLIKTNAVDFILGHANADTHLVTLGPYTNLAQAFLKDTVAMNQYGSITSMGGNYRARGNCSEVAEYNFWCDPEAASLVFSKVDEPITLLGLDVTRQIVLTPKHREWLRTQGSPIADFIYQITQFYVDFHLRQEGLHGCVINDPLVIAFILFPEMGAGIEGNLEMVCTGKNVGQSIIHTDQSKINVKILTRINSSFFFKLFFERVLKQTPPIQ